MKIHLQKGNRHKKRSDKYVALLLPYKKYNTYFRILIDEENKRALLQMVDNPKKWDNIPKEKYQQFRPLKRVELNITKLFVNYITPVHIVAFYGPTLGMNFPMRRVTIENFVEEKEKEYYIIETSMKYLQDIVKFSKKIINLSPHKKYDIIEKTKDATLS